MSGGPPPGPARPGNPAPRLRPFQPGDLDSLYAISLATGAAGGDASALYRDGRMLGHIYAAPYAVLSPETAFVALDAAGPAGFVLGTPDTHAFEDRLERDWWPALRARYPKPEGAPAGWNPDQQRCHRIHAPRRTPPGIAGPFPAHLHLNLLPRAQGKGWGRHLLAFWLRIVVPDGTIGVHVGVNPRNDRAIGFWQACGFRHLPSPGDVTWLGLGARGAGA